MVVLAFDIGILGTDLGENAVPQFVHVGQDIGFADQRQGVVLTDPARLPSVLAGIVEGVAQTACDLVIRVHHLLHRDLVAGALAREAADAGVETAGVFTDHAIIDLFRAFVLKRTLHAGIELDRAQIDVLVQLETQFQQHAFFKNARLDVGVADRAEIDGIEAAQLIERRIGQRLARPEIAGPAQVIRDRLQLEAEPLCRRVQHFAPLADHLRPRPVTRDHRDLVRLRHARFSL